MGEFKSVEGRLDVVEDRMRSLDGLLGEISTMLRVYDDMVGKMAKGLDEALGKIAVLEEELDKARWRGKSADKRIAMLEERVISDLSGK
jgi:uncharacterized coiled-coil protein SlyX